MARDITAEIISAGSSGTIRRFILVGRMCLPIVLAQIVSVAMQYVDASMAGSLGSLQAASIGLVAPTIWLLGGMSHAVNLGFSVQVSQLIGAGKDAEARNVMKTAFAVSFLFCCCVALFGVLISERLPSFLGGAPEISVMASEYFLVTVLSLPVMGLTYLASSMLQSSGHMRAPSVICTIMCVLDAAYNFLLMFPTKERELLGCAFTIPGADLGVKGAALGTALAEASALILLLFFLLFKNKKLSLRNGEKHVFRKECVFRAVRIGMPVEFEHLVLTGAMVATMVIISPLGSASVAAHSFGITAESLCYMAGFGISSAAAVIIGQIVGAGDAKGARKLAWTAVIMGSGFMGLSGVLMYAFAPDIMMFLTNDPEIIAMGAEALRIEAIAEPLYGASIVITGVMRGAGATLGPSLCNLFTMWAIRVPLSFFLAQVWGLSGAWIAMSGELCIRGLIFLAMMYRGRWAELAVVRCKKAHAHERC